ncbi:Carbonic anhydrase 4 [Larimichthys crocea]|uniref:Uncharacterized protein n=1 Tax=Larimichthys crocea TaxID=215358 RepID=A0ACD3RVF0_LARCR|nr:Carbonic anhydrase 4 [Larimichthys crocea]
MVQTDPKLLNFTFVNFTSQHVIKTIVYDGHTVKCKLKEHEVEVSGGGLDETYSTLQFHFHWGHTEHHPGSEHKINGYRYPMEMHIVSLKKGLTVDEAVKDSTGIAVLGFFINATEDGHATGPWSMLTSYLSNKTDIEPQINLNLSINDLIGNVDLTKYYRYMGSLTTPKCNEAVVWTVFHEPINLHKDLIQLFPMKTGLPIAYRPTQQLNTRQLHGAMKLMESVRTVPQNGTFCLNPTAGGDRQSPINIERKNAMVDKNLGGFTFTHFNDKHAIKTITNTGHTVKCKLKENTVEVSGGGLGHVYSTIQFHFHWGLPSHDSKGSEHTVDSQRYPMELHIVNKRKDLTLTQAVETHNGLAVLGFFIEAKEIPKSSSSSSSSSSGSSSGGTEHQGTNPTSHMAWTNLTNYLSLIKEIGREVTFTDEISIDDLLGDVNRDSYYRYNGSLTTPSCNEAVVWTVFKETIKVDQALMTAPGQLLLLHIAMAPVQSPIDIVTASAEPNDNLTDFSFTGFDDTSKLSLIENTGKTGQPIMETQAAAVQDPTGLAALGFFIEAMDGNESGQPASWKTLTSYLANITESGTNVSIAAGISLNDLLVGVNRSRYYRYLGSLTTPTCNEAVVWTVFKDPVKVSRDLIDLFSTLYVTNATSVLMTNVYRGIQPAQPVTTQRETSSSSKTACSLGLIALSLLLGKS